MGPAQAVAEHKVPFTAPPGATLQPTHPAAQPRLLRAGWHGEEVAPVGSFLPLGIRKSQWNGVLKAPKHKLDPEFGPGPSLLQLLSLGK